jgi:hypothetical protein
MKLSRMIVTGSALLIVAVVFLMLGIFVLPYQDIPSDPPTPLLVTIYNCVCFVPLWPFLVYAINPDLSPEWLLILIPVTVLFWGWVIEIILKRKARKRRDINLDPGCRVKLRQEF